MPPQNVSLKELNLSKDEELELSSFKMKLMKESLIEINDLSDDISSFLTAEHSFLDELSEGKCLKVKNKQKIQL